MGAIVLGAWRRLRHADLAFPQGRFMAAALVGACGLGLVSSVLDVPRVAFLVYLLLAVAFERSRWGPRWRED